MDRTTVSAVVLVTLLAPTAGWLALAVTPPSVGTTPRVVAALAVAGGVVLLARLVVWGPASRRAVGVAATVAGPLGYGGYYALSWAVGWEYPPLLFLGAVGFVTAAVYGPGRETLTAWAADES